MRHSQTERRQFPRLYQELPLNIEANGYDFSTTTHNLSCVGTYCTIKKYIPPFTKLDIKIDLPARGKKNSPIRCKGVIVRTEDEKNGFFNIAIFFNEIKETPRKKISNYVSQHLPAQ